MIDGGRPNAFHTGTPQGLKASRFRKSPTPIDMTRTPSALQKPYFSHPEVHRSLGTAGGSWKRYLSDEPPTSLFQTSPATPPHSTVKFVSHDALGSTLLDLHRCVPLPSWTNLAALFVYPSCAQRSTRSTPVTRINHHLSCFPRSM
jgi:hypothetical protein